MERGVHLLEVPGILKLKMMSPHFRFGRDVTDVLGDRGGQSLVAWLQQELEPANEQILVAAQRHGRAPRLPALRSSAGVESGPEHSEDDQIFGQCDEILNHYLEEYQLCSHAGPGASGDSAVGSE